MTYDFGGWATKFNVRCTDGRVISHTAFEDQDGTQVPLVWNHNHQRPEDVIGKAILKHAEEGVYAYCEFNDTDTGKTAKNLVMHGDITALSIFANKLKQEGNVVRHGTIRELSLVLAGANPGASIQEVLAHGDTNDDFGAVIYCDEDEFDLEHSSIDDEVLEHADDESLEHADSETLLDIYNSMTVKQQTAVALIAAQLLEDDIKEDDTMKHNVFENSNNNEDTLQHTACLREALDDISKFGGNSLRDAVMQHAATHGIENIDMLFPPEQNIQNEPQMIGDDTSWATDFIHKVKKSPFSRLKAVYSDATGEQARALGYTKGNLKKDQVITLLKRTTQPTTVYMKQKMDRDDKIDITDFAVVAWLKKEMRMKLDEELARAMLIGDGRSSAAPDKIKPDCIRPIVGDSSLYTIEHVIPADCDNVAKEFIRGCIKARGEYEGHQPILYTTEAFLADMLLLEDATGRFIYEDEAQLCKVLRVTDIVTVPVLKNHKTTSDNKTFSTHGIIVNPNDYFMGADKGGQVSLFDGFDIDYNQYKYLMETRCSGALMKPKTAIVIKKADSVV